MASFSTEKKYNCLLRWKWHYVIYLKICIMFYIVKIKTLSGGVGCGKMESYIY